MAVGFVKGKVRQRDMERMRRGDGVLAATGPAVNSNKDCLSLVGAGVSSPMCISLPLFSCSCEEEWAAIYSKSQGRSRC